MKKITGIFLVAVLCLTAGFAQQSMASISTTGQFGNDVDMFMDALISAHAYAGKGVHKLFNRALIDDEDFQTLGHAFLIGLLEDGKKDDENKDNKKEGNE